MHSQNREELLTSTLEPSTPLLNRTARHDRETSSCYRSQRLALACDAALLCGGCGVLTSPDLDPKGHVALAQCQFLFDAVLVMMIMIVPIFIMTALFTWRYRGANRNARYMPNFAYYWPVEILIWCVPAAIIGWLSLHLWGSTHRLDPYKPIDTGVKPLRSRR